MYVVITYYTVYLVKLNHLHRFPNLFRKNILPTAQCRSAKDLRKCVTDDISTMEAKKLFRMHHGFYGIGAFSFHLPGCLTYDTDNLYTSGMETGVLANCPQWNHNTVQLSNSIFRSFWAWISMEQQMSW